MERAEVQEQVKRRGKDRSSLYNCHSDFCLRKNSKSNMYELHTRSFCSTKIQVFMHEKRSRSNPWNHFLRLEWSAQVGAQVDIGWCLLPFCGISVRKCSWKWNFGSFRWWLMKSNCKIHQLNVLFNSIQHSIRVIFVGKLSAPWTSCLIPARWAGGASEEAEEPTKQTKKKLRNKEKWVQK